MGRLIEERGIVTETIGRSVAFRLAISHKFGSEDDEERRTASQGSHRFNPDTYCHVDCHVSLSDSIHGTADKRRLEYDIAGDTGVGNDLMGSEVDMTGQEQEIVVSETASAVGARVH